MQSNEPTVTIRVPRGASLGDIAKLQASLFAHPEKLPPELGHLIRGCPNCLSGMRIELGEEVVSPVTRDLQEMFTHLSTEMRTISSRLSSLERGAVRTAPTAPTELITSSVNEIDY